MRKKKVQAKDKTRSTSISSCVWNALIVSHSIVVTSSCVEKDDICHWQGTTCYQKWAEQRWVWHLPGGGKAVKALLSLKQYLNYVTASGCIYCGFMELWTSDLCLAYVQLSSFTSVCTKAMCMSSRVYEIAAELIWIHQCQNYKSPLTWKWTLVLSVPVERANVAYFYYLFFPFLVNTDLIYRSQDPLPFFLSWPYDPKEAGLADLLINSQSPSLEALLHIGLLL